VFLLILKKTSSPEDVKTYESDTAREKDAKLRQKFSAFIGRIVPLACRTRGHTLMLIGANARILLLGGSWVLGVRHGAEVTSGGGRV
jgi:hypothetical protein